MAYLWSDFRDMFPSFRMDNSNLRSLSSSQINDVGNYYSYIRPDIQTNKWYRFDDEFVTRVDFTDDIDDAYGGSCAALR